MTARELHFLCRDVAIWAAKRGGLKVEWIALAHGISKRRVQEVLRAFADQKTQSAALEKILDALSPKPLPRQRGRTGRALRAAAL